MSTAKKLDENGLALIKHCEGLALKAYPDPASQDKTYSIGYGHFGVSKDLTCTEEEATAWLLADVANEEADVNIMVKTELIQGQFNALVSFVHNEGSGHFQKSTMLKLLNAGDIAGAYDEFPKWNKVNGVRDKGLAARRVLEQAEFAGKGWRSALC